MERPQAPFEIDEIKLRKSGVIADFPSEPVESAAYWKTVALRQKYRLDQSLEKNRANSQLLARVRRLTEEE